MIDTLVILPTIAGRCEPAASVLHDAANGFDVFVVLDGMTDVDDRAHLRFWPVQQKWERRGLVAGTNDGFAHFLAGAWSHLILLEDGLTLTPGWDTALRRTLDAHPGFGWVACGQIENDKAPFTTFCSMMTRACAEKVRGLDPVFSPCQFDDGDLFMRCLVAGFTPHAVTHKVHHPEARTSRVGTVEDDWALIEAHRGIFAARWGLPDFRWDLVPVHKPCVGCMA